LKLHNFLSSGLSFDEVEENLAFRFRFLNALMLVAIIAPLIFVLLDQFGINALGNIQLFATKLYAFVAVLVVMYLHGRKQAYTICARIVIVASYLLFSSAMINVPNDELRVIWYYILVVAAYVLLGNGVGLSATAASILTVSTAKIGLGIAMSDNAFFTFILSLSVTSGIAYSYTNLANSYFERMTFNFNQLRELASKDPLTGLWNARAFYDMTNTLIRVGQRQVTPYCTLFIDLDHFKSINDQYGHDTGDAVLCAVANCIARNCRESDIIGRIGGEEFVIFLPNTNARGAMLLAEKVRGDAASLMHIFPNNEQRAVTLSIGVAESSISDQTIASIQKRADMAMYEAKKQGRNRVSFLAAVAV